MIERLLIAVFTTLFISVLYGVGVAFLECWKIERKILKQQERMGKYYGIDN